jgi:hypothetical protein
MAGVGADTSEGGAFGSFFLDQMSSLREEPWPLEDERRTSMN